MSAVFFRTAEKWYDNRNNGLIRNCFAAPGQDYDLTWKPNTCYYFHKGSNDMNIFGPVPSRRLGQSLGINNIPPKKCSYSCVYCQLGRTSKMQIIRDVFYNPESLAKEAENKLNQLKRSGEKVDYLTFVADGEPELDINLGYEIDLLKKFGIKVAVISNASLIWDEQVKHDLAKADWVSLKVDAADESIWKKIDRPHGHLKLEEILKGIKEFSTGYKGKFVTETMLVKGINDSKDSLDQTADYIKELDTSISYILVPTRPPAENDVARPDIETIKSAFEIFTKAGIKTECITGDEGDHFIIEQDVVNGLLDIASVHPIKQNVLEKLLKENNCKWDIINKLLERDILESYTYENNTFYVRKISKRGGK